eukprot:11545966-Ditylum_brightwellii.AAC.1
MTHLISPKVKFIWGLEQKATFLAIKRTITCKVLLHFPGFSKLFNVYTDASNYQLGSVIVQEDYPVAFHSHKLTPVQQNYTTMEKEL